MQMTAKRFLMASVLAVCLSGVALAQPYSPPSGTNVLYAGGINPNPQMASTNISAGRVTVGWNGFLGPYKLWRSSNNWVSSNLVTTVNSTARSMTYKCLSSVPTNSKFKVTGPVPKYASAYGRCSTCHAQKSRDWVNTPHAVAFDGLIAIGQETNSACLPCHTVGYGLTTGYVETKPYLADVQCENCHGPVGGHAGTYSTPAVSLNSKVCGGCHNGYNPQYNEWTESVHGRTEYNMRYGKAGDYLAPGQTKYTIGEVNKRMETCGACHWSAARQAMMLAYPTKSLPTAAKIWEVGNVGCTACHDPHAAHESTGGYNLRYPLYSTNAYLYDYNWYTNVYGSASTNFATGWANAATAYRMATNNFLSQYDTSVMVCGQCHRGRNVDQVVTTNSPYRNTATHASHQYNINAANIGTGHASVTLPDMSPANTTSMRHGRNDLGENSEGETCTVCHMDNGDHTFEVSTNGCYQSTCHTLSSTNIMDRVTATSLNISNMIVGVRARLDFWTNSPAATSIVYSGTNTKALVKWEYTSAGKITTAWGVPVAGVGLEADQQDLIPIEIRQARQNLYLVVNEMGVTKDYGIHNPEWCRYLILSASNLVENVIGL